jgi:hypothetical protein
LDGARRIASERDFKLKIRAREGAGKPDPHSTRSRLCSPTWMREIWFSGVNDPAHARLNRFWHLNKPGCQQLAPRGAAILGLLPHIVQVMRSELGEPGE